MKRALLSSIVFLFSLSCFSGCAMNVGKAKYPEPTSGFQPVAVYDQSFDKVWSTAMSVLDFERIGISSSDKEGGRITTDYVQGVTQMQGLGLLGTLTTRYNYAIMFEKVSQDKTKMSIVCRLESMSEKLGWHEISKDNKAIVNKMENWLYERIEKSM